MSQTRVGRNDIPTTTKKEAIKIFAQNKTTCIFVWKQPKGANEKFEVLFLTEARAFLLNLDQKSRDKIIFNIDKAKVKTDNELFKKLKGEIWEFRTLFNKTHYRIFAFWDKENKQETLVLTTHGIIKKTDKTPEKEIEKAEQIRLKYFELKEQQNGNKK